MGTRTIGFTFYAPGHERAPALWHGMAWRGTARREPFSARSVEPGPIGTRTYRPWNLLVDLRGCADLGELRYQSDAEYY